MIEVDCEQGVDPFCESLLRSSSGKRLSTVSVLLSTTLRVPLTYLLYIHNEDTPRLSQGMLQGLNMQEVNHSTQVLLERSYKPIDPNDTQAESTSSDPGPSTTQSSEVGQDIETFLAVQQVELDRITAILDDLMPQMNNQMADVEQFKILQNTP